MSTEQPKRKTNVAPPGWRLRTQEEADAIERRALTQEPTSLLERGILVWIPRIKDGERRAHP